VSSGALCGGGVRVVSYVGGVVARVALVLAAVVLVVLGAASGAAAANNNIFTVAGSGTAGFSGDGAAATSAKLDTPHGVAATADGGLLIADTGNNRVRRVSPAGIISTVAGSGTKGFSGDGAAATSASLNFPFGVAATADGGVLIADTNNNRVRRVSPAGVISTVAGTGGVGGASGEGFGGFSGDGAAATSAELDFPVGVAATADGGLLIADTSNDRVRRVSPAGVISTVAGSGTAGFSGDGAAATSAELSFPFGVAATADGGVLIADTGNDRVRRVSPAGVISTVAGSGTAGFSGDCAAATSAKLNGPDGVAATADGGLLIADTDNNRVRRVDAGDPPPGPSPSPLATRAVCLKVSLSPRSPRAKSAAKAKLSLTLNVAARVTVRLDRIVAGRKNAKRCVKATRRNRSRRKCKRPTRVAARTLTATAGINTLTLGRLAAKKKLPRGSYRITVSEAGAAKKTIAFKIRASRASAQP